MFTKGINRFSRMLLLATIVTIFFSMTMVVYAAGTKYYVSPGGDNGNSGTIDKPWKSINYAAKKLKAGDTLYVREGVYNETVDIPVSGSSSGGYITITAYSSEKAVLDGTGLDPKEIGDGMHAMINISDKSFIKIVGLEIKNYTTTVQESCISGINVDGACQNIEIRNNYVHSIKNLAEVDDDLNGRDAHGICVYGTGTKAISGLVIDGNTITDCVLGSSESLTVNGNVDGFAVTNNKVYNNDNIGICFIGYEEFGPTEATDRARNGVCRGNIVYNIDSYGNPAYGEDKSADGIYCDGATNIVIEKNIVHHVNFGIELASEHKGKSTSNITVRDNVVYNCENAGLALGGYDKQRGNSTDNIITNNTFYQNDTRKVGFGEVYIQYDTRNNVIKNNIFYANSNGTFIYNEYKENTGNVVDYNIYYSDAAKSDCYWTWKTVAYEGFEDYKNKTGNDKNSLFVNPGFKNAQGKDFSLQFTSPAINIGDPSFVSKPASDGVIETDMAGNTRVIGTRVDCGAYEVQNVMEAKPVPVITNIKVDAGSQQATITWTTDIPSSTKVSYGPVFYTDNVATGENNVTNHSITIKGLVPTRTYYFRVFSANEDGKEAQSDTKTFNTPMIAPIVIPPPVLNVPEIAKVTATEATITWKTDTPATSVVVYGKTNTYTDKMESKNYVTEHKLDLTGLEAGTGYYYRIEATDNLGQKSVSQDYSFTTDKPAPPVVEDPVVEDPVVEDPVVEDPVVEDPVVEDPEVPTPSEKVVDDKSSSIKYSSGWRGYKDSGDYKKSHHQTTNKGSSAKFTFTGTSISWISQMDMNYGIAEVYVDNVLEATVDLYAPSTTYQQVVFSKSDLKYGKHTIKIVCKGQKNKKSRNKYVTVDAFNYY